MTTVLLITSALPAAWLVWLGHDGQLWLERWAYRRHAND